MLEPIEIKLDKDENLNLQLDEVKKRKKLYQSLWRLFTISNKSLMIINFSTILFSIFTPNSNIPLILSIFTLSFSSICDTRIYESILEKLINIYEDEIILDVDKYIRDYQKNNIDNDNNNNKDCDPIYDIQQIEKKHLTKHLGQSFTLPTALRKADWKRIVAIGVFYIVCFISIAVLCYFKSTGDLKLSF